MSYASIGTSFGSGISDKELIHKFPGTGGKGHFSFPSPFFDVASQFMPRNIKDMFKWCFTPDTLVFVNKGSFKSIEDVILGDEVLTETGEWKPVINTLVREVDEDIYKIYLHGLSSIPITVTGNHEFPTRSGRKRVSELSTKDFLYSAVMLPSRNPDIDYDPYLLGLYAGDGCPIYKYKSGDRLGIQGFQLDFGAEEVELIEKVKGLLSTYSTSVVLTYDLRPTKNQIVLRCYDQILAKWLFDMCPGKAYSKSLNSKVFEFDKTSISRLLGGLRDSDGSKAEIYYGVNKLLALQVMKLAETLNIIPSLSKYKARTTPYGKTKACWVVRVRKCDSSIIDSIKQTTPSGSSKSNLAFVQDNKIFRRIKKIERVPYKGRVHTLTVKDIHSYSIASATGYNCEHIHLNNGVVSSCIERTVKYPITNLQFGTEDADIKHQYEEIMTNQMSFRDAIGNIGIDLYSYGNSFISVHFPFTRMLKCPSCKMQTMIHQAIKVRFDEYKFHATCRCKYKGVMEIIDRPSRSIKGLHLKRWDPHYIDIAHNSITGESKYYYTIPPKDKLRIKAGDINFVAGLPKVFFDIVEHNKTLAFNEESLLHLKTSSLAGLNAEWGIPTTLRTFKLHYYNAILRKANEAIALDYLTPIRVMYPDTRGEDVGQFANMNRYKIAALDMIRKHRQDPGDAYFFPFPVGYQAIGGEGKTLNLMPEIKLANEEIMNSMGFPQQLFYGDLTIQSAPVALRLLENTMSTWIDGMNKLSQWTADKISRYYHLPRIPVSWAEVTLVDDLQKKELLMNLVGAQKIADDTFLNTIGTSIKEELRKRYQQMELESELDKEFQEKQQKRSEGNPNAQGQGGPPSLQSLEEQSQQLAEQWLQMPYEQRRQEMNNLSQQDPALYALASKIMERMRSSSQGYSPSQAPPPQQGQPQQ